MFHLLLGFVLTTNFLGFSKNSTILDVTNHFGSPYSVQNTNNKNVQMFLYKRNAYEATVFCGKKGQVLQIDTYGVNQSVNYNKVKLTDTFKNVIYKMGKPESYNFKDNFVTLNYPNSHFTLAKAPNSYQVVKISVDFN